MPGYKLLNLQVTNKGRGTFGCVYFLFIMEEAYCLIKWFDLNDNEKLKTLEKRNYKEPVYILLGAFTEEDKGGPEKQG